jgi:hypothetical protein
VPGFLRSLRLLSGAYEKRRGVSSAYCWFPIASSFRFEKPLERPIPPLVATASALGQGCESIEILRRPSGNAGREGSCRKRAEKRHVVFKPAGLERMRLCLHEDA